MILCKLFKHLASNNLTKKEMLKWIEATILANKSRSKLGKRDKSCSENSFCINIFDVLLDYCQPFVNR